MKQKKTTKLGEKKCQDDTHTLRQVLGSNPGGRFPLGIGSICKIKKWKKKTTKKKQKNKEQNIHLIFNCLCSQWFQPPNRNKKQSYSRKLAPRPNFGSQVYDRR